MYAMESPGKENSKRFTQAGWDANESVATLLGGGKLYLPRMGLKWF